MHQILCHRRTLTLLLVITAFLLIIYTYQDYLISTNVVINCPQVSRNGVEDSWGTDVGSSGGHHALFSDSWFPAGVTGDNETGFPMYIVPNIVHYVMFQDHKLSFVHYISILSVLKNQNPDAIYIHCDCDELRSEFWARLMSDPSAKEKIKVLRMERPDSVYGIKLSREFINWHASDLARQEVLMKYGGIYLDRDVFIVQSLDPFRKFEMSLGWDEGQNLGTMILIANKAARFLHLWRETYKAYKPSLWYYNAGELPTKTILNKHPHLVHRVKILFGVDNLCHFLYREDSPKWREFYSIHMLMRGGTVREWCLNVPVKDSPKFSMETIKTSRTTFGRMVRSLIYGKEDVIQ